MKSFALIAMSWLISAPAFAVDYASNPCGRMAVELEPQIHQKFEAMGVDLGNELMATSWVVFKTSDGKYIIVRKSYVASPNGEITDELMATAECDSVSKHYVLMDVNAGKPVLKLKLNY